jgi:predicted phage terminase large subunit-like protein
LIKEKYLKTFSHQEKKFQKYYISIDTASNTQENNDYSVILIFAIENFNLYVVEVLRKKLEYSQLKNELLNYIKQYNPINILIENKGSGICLIQDFKRNHNIKAINPKGSKEDRLLRRLYFFEQEMVFLNKEMKEIEEFKRELISFPKVKHDDQLDALVQAIEFTASLQDLNNKVRIRSIAL